MDSNDDDDDELEACEYDMEVVETSGWGRAW